MEAEEQPFTIANDQEESELVVGDWAARAEDDRKPEYVKRLQTV